MKSIVAERGQVTIPNSLRDKLGIRPGTALEFSASNGTRAAFASDDAFQRAMRTLGVSFSAPTEPAASLAGVTCKAYRTAGGKRNRVIADFVIGAHAVVQCDRLLTRDRGYYKKCFAGLVVVEPSA